MNPGITKFRLFCILYSLLIAIKEEYAMKQDIAYKDYSLTAARETVSNVPEIYR